MAQPITSTLEDAARDTTGAALQKTLVDLVDLSLVAKQAHWNLVGRQFHDVHLHLDELVDLAREYADKVAERAAAIGVSPDGRSRTVADASTVPAFAEGWARDRDVIRYVSEALDTVERYLLGSAPSLTQVEVCERAGVPLEIAQELWRLLGKTDAAAVDRWLDALHLTDLAEDINPQVRGWFGYYGAFYRSELGPLAWRIDQHLVRWAMHKFKRLKGRPARAWAWLDAVRLREPTLFAHWHLLPIIRSRPAGAV